MSFYNIVRNDSGLADLQKWSRLEISGIDAAEVLDESLGCNVLDLFEGRIANTLIPSLTGGIDAIVWIISLEHSFWVIGEPEDKGIIESVLTASVKGRNVIIHDLQKEKFFLVLAGPEAETIAEKAWGDDIYSIPFLNALTVGSPTVLAARMGFFGEYELHLFGNTIDKNTVINQLKSAAGNHELVPTTDQAALSVMMAEMRVMSRHRDIPASTSVFEAGLHWMIDFRKENLRALSVVRERKSAVKDKCVLVLAEGNEKNIDKQNIFIDKIKIGQVQSSYWSGTIKKTVVLAYLSAEFGLPGLECTIGENYIPAATVSAPAFFTKSILNSLNKN